MENRKTCTLSLVLAMGLLLFIQCQSEKKPTRISINSLEKTFQLPEEIPVDSAPQIIKICQDFDPMSEQEIKKKLERPNTDLFTISYGYYFLGMRQLENNKVKKGLASLHRAADDLLNPLAMSQLALIYSQKKEDISKQTQQEGIDFKQDFGLSFQYLIQALNISVYTMDYFKDRTALDDVQRYRAPLLQIIEKRDSLAWPGFNFLKAEEKAKKERPQLEQKFKILFRVD